MRSFTLVCFSPACLCSQNIDLEPPAEKPPARTNQLARRVRNVSSVVVILKLGDSILAWHVMLKWLFGFSIFNPHRRGISSRQILTGGLKCLS